MWKSKSLLSAALAALLLLGLPILAGGRLPAALAQVSVSFKEWPVPTKGSHPHDPLAAADGSLWYTGQMASTLGRLDPETGVFKEYRTNVPNSGPHGLVADQDGNIWFTASFAAISASSTRTQARSPNIGCRLTPAIRTRRCSTRRETSGSRSSARTRSAGWCRRPVK
jgi:streptogramin lyase